MPPLILLPPSLTYPQGGSAAASPLQLPQLQADTVDVSFSDQRLAGDAVAAGSVPQSAWLKMEALLAGGDMSSSNWLEGFKQVGGRCSREYRMHGHTAWG